VTLVEASASPTTSVEASASPASVTSVEVSASPAASVERVSRERERTEKSREVLR
jgi:hypothetical protein